MCVKFISCDDASVYLYTYRYMIHNAENTLNEVQVESEVIMKNKLNDVGTIEKYWFTKHKNY